MTNQRLEKNVTERLYYLTLRIRMIEESIAREYPKQEMRTPTHLHIGQEAIPAGVCAALEQKDYIFGYYRSHGWYIAKGGNLGRMMGELYGKSSGCSKGYGGSMHLIDLDVGFTGTSAIVAGAMPHAVGAAFTFKYNKTGQVAISCFGDAATEEGVFQESVMFAALRKLPVVFICENNRIATNTMIEQRQPPVPIYKRAEGFGAPTFLIDGNDATEVYRVAKVAIERARKGEGPTFIECTTYRPLEHCGPNTDFHLGHRTAEEAETWKKRDPLMLIEKQVDATFASRLKTEFEAEIVEAFRAAKAAPFPTSLIPEGLTCL